MDSDVIKAFSKFADQHRDACKAEQEVAEKYCAELEKLILVYEPYCKYWSEKMFEGDNNDKAIASVFQQYFSVQLTSIRKELNLQEALAKNWKQTSEYVQKEKDNILNRLNKAKEKTNPTSNIFDNFLGKTIPKKSDSN